MLTSKQRAFLRGMANKLPAVFQVGKGGINEMLISQVTDYLELKELIKLTVLETAPVTSREAADSMAAAVNAEVVQVIGGKFILYKESKEHKQIELPKVKKVK